MSSKAPPQLSQRLFRLLELAGTGDVLWDVGCDHGLLGRWALFEERFRSVHFVDPAPLVIEKLRQSIDSDIPKGSFFIHQEKANQVEAIGGNEAVVMAGFGAKAMIEGLKALETTADLRVILSPHRDTLDLREYLRSQNWGLEHEEIFLEDEQFYPVLKVSKRATREVSLYGEEQWRTEAGQGYRARLLEKLSLHQNPQDQGYLNYLRKVTESIENP